MQNVEAGDYDIRYQNLDSGVISKSQPFKLEENQEDIQLPDRVRHRIQSTDFQLTLYEVVNGNTHSQIIGPEEF